MAYDRHLYPERHKSFSHYTTKQLRVNGIAQEPGITSLVLIWFDLIIFQSSPDLIIKPCS